MSSGRRTVHRPPPGGIIINNGRSTYRYSPEEYDNYLRILRERMREDFERRRREEAARRVTDRGSMNVEIDSVEMYAKNNAKAHHTEMYETVENGSKPTSVLRRGQPFYLGIRFKRTLDFQKDRIVLEFSYGPYPQYNKRTLVRLPVHPSNEFRRGEKAWDVRMHHHDGQILTLYVNIPATVPVGLWKFRIISHSGYPSRSNVFDVKDSIYILFNPWCKEDAVYMPQEELLKEYVLNDAGKIFVGGHAQVRGRQWIYGQFTDAVLPASVFVLEQTKLDYPTRANPIRVVRAISALINSNDDDGVIEGNWSGKYEGGVAPWMWTGSSAILEKYFTSGGIPVKYGQCWVFAGVFTTVCRALGIPTRTVTCFVSAHDTDDSLSVDKYFDKNMEELEDHGSDSIWNFHVWNDCWMARPDLPTGYGGWQACDSTPQETSDGAYQTGPASVCAIRRGEIGFMYDAPFVYAEVNADVIHWQQDDNSELGYKRMKTYKYHVGRKILTKKAGIEDDAGDRDAEDITQEYKNPEGTESERMSMLNAARARELYSIHDLPTPDKEDVVFDLIDIDKIQIGQPFRLVLKARNSSDEKRNVHAILSANSIYYTGVHAKKLKRHEETFEMQPRSEETRIVEVTPNEYLGKLVDYCNVKIYALATVKETKQAWSEEDDFVIEKPTLLLNIRGELKVGKPFELHVKFTNPLKRVLGDCSFTLEGPGLSEPHTKSFRDVQPEESVDFAEMLTPKRPGPREILVVFNSDELVDVTGSVHVNVAP